MIAKETLDFLKKLEKNNEREWFQANKERFISAQDNVLAIAGELIGQISKFDPEVSGTDPKGCIFRIYRDVRFSADKSPYKTNLGGYIAPGGRRSMLPGYYFHIQPKMFFVAAGKHMPDAAELLKIRTYIAADPDELFKITGGKKFREHFGELNGDRLTRPPKGFDADHPAIEFLKLRSFTVTREFTEKEALSPDYPKLITGAFKTAFPLVAFLRKALRQ